MRTGVPSLERCNTRVQGGRLLQSCALTEPVPLLPVEEGRCVRLQVFTRPITVYVRKGWLPVVDLLVVDLPVLCPFFARYLLVARDADR